MENQSSNAGTRGHHALTGRLRRLITRPSTLQRIAPQCFLWVPARHGIASGAGPANPSAPSQFNQVRPTCLRRNSPHSRQVFVYCRLDSLILRSFMNAEIDRILAEDNSCQYLPKLSTNVFPVSWPNKKKPLPTNSTQETMSPRGDL